MNDTPALTQPSSRQFGLNAGMRWVWIALLVLLGSATLLRLYDLDAPGILPVREYRSALMARNWYFRGSEDLPAWRQEAVADSVARSRLLEPPILEAVIVLLYRVAGGEHLWLARVVSALLWVAGGAVLFSLAREMTDPYGALWTTAYYLFVPLGVLTSRSFQPDALMVFGLLLSLLAIWRYGRQPTLNRLLLAGGSAGLTLLVRPLPIFFLFGAYGALVWGGRLEAQRSRLRDSLTFAGLALAPSFLYYGSGVLLFGFLQDQVAMSFQPYLWLHRTYWKNWLLTGLDAAGVAIILGGMLGFLVMEPGQSKRLLWGLCGGYGAFGLAFSYHISTHSYYQIQLLLIVALALGPLGSLLSRAILSRKRHGSDWMPIAAIAALILVLNLRTIREGMASVQFEAATTAQEIGEIVNHSTQVVFISHFYGLPLEYHGEMSGTYWPRATDNIPYLMQDGQLLSLQERLDSLDFVPQYYVITHFADYGRHHADLQNYLESECSLVAHRTADYLIYGNCSPRANEPMPANGDAGAGRMGTASLLTERTWDRGR